MEAKRTNSINNSNGTALRKITVIYDANIFISCFYVFLFYLFLCFYLLMFLTSII